MFFKYNLCTPRETTAYVISSHSLWAGGDRFININRGRSLRLLLTLNRIVARMFNARLLSLVYGRIVFIQDAMMLMQFRDGLLMCVSVQCI